MNFTELTSAQNTTFKKLRQYCTQAKTRNADKLIMLDGVHLCQEWSEEFAYLIVSESFAKHHEAKPFLTHKHYRLSDFLFEKLASTKTPSGLIGLVKRPIATNPKLNRVIVLENLQDPGNLGTIIRTAAAADFDTVILSPGSVDAWSPKVLRAAMGGHFKLQILENYDLTDLPKDFDSPIYGTFMEGKDIFATELSERSAFVFGNEGAGISAETAKICSQKVSIPMQNKVESLNVAMSAGICMYEQWRQRHS